MKISKIQKKSIAFVIIVAVLLGVTGFLLLNNIPIKREVYKTIEGISWDANTEEYETVEVNMSGYYYDYILEMFHHDYYSGDFDICNIDATNEDKYAGHFLFAEKANDSGLKRATMWYVPNDAVDGSIITDRDFSKIYIDYTEKESEYSMVFPAKDLEEAKILKEEMSKGFAQ